jgi:ATP-dependent RNA helicase DeaD
VEECLQGEVQPVCSEMVTQLIEKGYSERQIAVAALQFSFGTKDYPEDIVAEEEPPAAAPLPKERKPAGSVRLKPSKYDRISIDIGSIHHVAPNHIVGALTEHSALHGSDIGKVEVFPTYCLVEIPSGTTDEVIEAMAGCKIRGRGVKAEARPEFPKNRHHSSEAKKFPKKGKWAK